MLSPTDRRPAALGLAFVLVLAACSAAGSPSATPPAASPGPSALPTGSPGPSTAGVIDHPTGRDEIVLRFGEGGGFVMPTFAMVQLPSFSLYGDGTVLYRPASAPWPETKPGEPMRFPPLQVARMTEAQVQALLVAGLGEGGLGIARERYENAQVADAPTAVFTVNADGRQKRVSVYALGLAVDDPDHPNPDVPILTAMASLAERLRNFDLEVGKGNAEALGTYAPTRFRASLLEGGPAGDGVPRPWPWPTFGPADFVEVDDGTGLSFPSKALSGLEVSLLGVKNPEGGISGITLVGPDGKTYGLGLRPLLPDERR